MDRWVESGMGDQVGREKGRDCGREYGERQLKSRVI